MYNSYTVMIFPAQTHKRTPCSQKIDTSRDIGAILGDVVPLFEAAVHAPEAAADAPAAGAAETPAPAATRAASASADIPCVIEPGPSPTPALAAAQKVRSFECPFS